MKKKEPPKSYLNREFLKFKKNLGKNKPYVESLNDKMQFDLFLHFKKYKHFNLTKNKSISKGDFFEKISKIQRFRPSVSKIRESRLKLILEQ